MIARCVISMLLLVFALVRTGHADSATGSDGSQFTEAEQSEVLLRFGGDVMLARDITRAIRRSGPRFIWGDLIPFLNEADVTLVNLESVISDKGAKFKPERKYYFRADPAAIDALRSAGIDYVSLANNHALDYGAEGLLDTIGRLEQAGISHSGAGVNRKAAAEPAILNVNNLKIAVLSFANHYLAYSAEEDRPGTNVVKIQVEKSALEPMIRAIENTKDLGADIVVVSMHWGENWRRYPRQRYVDYARAVIDSGADIFHGHSAHIFQGIEIYKDKLIMYDTGDLIDDYAINRVIRNDYQILVSARLTAQRLLSVEITPLVFEGLQVTLAKGRDRELISRKLSALSQDFSTTIKANENGRLIAVAGE